MHWRSLGWELPGPLGCSSLPSASLARGWLRGAGTGACRGNGPGSVWRVVPLGCGRPRALLLLGERPCSWRGPSQPSGGDSIG